MQITDLLVPERVALNMQVADKAMAIHAMVGMLDRTGGLRDAANTKKCAGREAQAATGVGGGGGHSPRQKATRCWCPRWRQ